MVRKALLVRGILSSLLYVAMTVFSAMRWESYSSASQAISELSAIGAPTRPLWVLLGIPETLAAGGSTLIDTMHIVLGSVTVLLIGLETRWKLLN